MYNIFTDEHSAGNFKDGGQNASLADGEDFGSDRSAETVGNVISTDAKGQDEWNDESEDDDPEQVDVVGDVAAFRCYGRRHHFVHRLANHLGNWGHFVLYSC